MYAKTMLNLFILPNSREYWRNGVRHVWRDSGQEGIGPKYPIDVRTRIASPAMGRRRKKVSFTLLHLMNGIRKPPKRITTPGWIHSIIPDSPIPFHNNPHPAQ